MIWSRYRPCGLGWNKGLILRFRRTGKEVISRNNTIQILDPETFQIRNIWGKCEWHQGFEVNIPSFKHHTTQPIVVGYSQYTGRSIESLYD